jgi:exosortase
MDVTDSNLHYPKKAQFFLPVILLVLFIGLFHSTFAGLYSRWIRWDESLSHGLLVAGIFIYFLYRSLPWQTTPNSKPLNLLLLIALGGTSCAWFVFQLSNIYIFEQLLLLGLFALLLANSYGLKTVLNHRLLLFLPIFIIPIWDQLNEPLVNLSGFMVGKMVQAISMPAVIEGNSIFIPFGHIVIADGCSGLRYFEIALALAYIISLLNHYNEKQLLPTLMVAAALGLLANWIRIFALVIIGYQSKMQSSLMSDHEYFGWALFGAMCLPAIYFAPVIKVSIEKKTTGNQTLPRLWLPLAVLAIGPLLSIAIDSQPKQEAFKPVLPPDHQAFANMKMPVAVTAPEQAYVEKGLITAPTGSVSIEIHQYQRIHKTDKLVPYIGRLYNNEEWLASNNAVSVLNHSAKLTRFRQKTSNREVIQIQWFEIGDYKTSSLIVAKLLQVPALVTGANRFKIVTLQSQCPTDDCDVAQTLILEKLPLIFSNHN